MYRSISNSEIIRCIGARKQDLAGLKKLKCTGHNCLCSQLQIGDKILYIGYYEMLNYTNRALTIISYNSNVNLFIGLSNVNNTYLIGCKGENRNIYCVLEYSRNDIYDVSFLLSRYELYKNNKSVMKTIKLPKDLVNIILEYY